MLSEHVTREDNNIVGIKMHGTGVTPGTNQILPYI